MNRRTFLTSLGATLAAGWLFPRRGFAMGPQSRFTIAQLRYDGGNFDPRPTALRRLLLEVEKRTSVEVLANPPKVSANTPQLFEHPFLTLSGDRKFSPFSDESVANLRTYLQSGGFLFVDSAEGVHDGPFIEAVKREIRRILPDKKIVRIPTDHVLYKSFYLIDEPVGRLAVTDSMLGVFDDDRLAVVISQNDMLGAWARDNFGSWKYECSPGGERQREIAYRMGINLVMYALCINYKADQVHVPFILKRRKWKVE